MKIKKGRDLDRHLTRTFIAFTKNVKSDHFQPQHIF
jgi:hypothetical protein